MDRETARDFFEEYNSIDKYNNVRYVLSGRRANNIDVSIMIPTYKRQGLLLKAVRSALSQNTQYSMEIVIVDNDSETTKESIEKFLSELNDTRVCYVQNKENIGMFGNWNRCIKLANSDWIIILSDDDEIEEDYIENMMRSATAIEKCKALCCRRYLIDEKECFINEKEKYSKREKVVPITLKDLYLMQPIDIMGCLFNRTAAIKIGGFNEAFFPCSDAVFLLRMCVEDGLYLNTKKLFRYRWAVNESLKPDIRIDFAKFQVHKSFEINKKFGFYGTTINKFVTNAKCDYSFYPLIMDGIINKDIEENLRLDMGLDKKYSSFRRFIYRVIRRLNIYVINSRKDAVL